MIKVAAIAAFLFVLLAANAERAAACLPPPDPPTTEERAARADAIFVGSVAWKTPWPPWNIVHGDGEYRVTFNVSRVWKGQVGRRVTVRVHSEYRDECGIRFERGKDYLVYARYRDDGNLRVGGFSAWRVRRDRDTADLRETVLGSGWAPEKNWWTLRVFYFAAGALVSSLVVFLTALVRHARR